MNPIYQFVVRNIQIKLTGELENSQKENFIKVFMNKTPIGAKSVDRQLQFQWLLLKVKNH